MVWAGPMTTSKLWDSLHFHIKEILSLLKACLADMPKYAGYNASPWDANYVVWQLSTQIRVNVKALSILG